MRWVCTLLFWRTALVAHLLLSLPPSSWAFSIGNSSSAFPIGIMLPITSYSQGLLAVAAAIELDFRKNYDEALRQRLGPPVVPISDLHPELRLQVVIGTSHSSSAVAIDTLLTWLAGDKGVPRIRGLVGDVSSAISIPLAAIASARSIPQVSGGSTSPLLSNKRQYPFFLRTIGSDVEQGHAIASWIRLFEVKLAVMVYSQEPYGQGLFQSTSTSAAAQAALPGGGASLLGLPVDWDFEHSVSVALAQGPQICQEILSKGTKFIILGIVSIQITPLLFRMEEAGMLYGSHQFLGSESSTVQPSGMHVPSQGLPSGFQKFQPQPHGPLSTAFEELWRKLSVEDLYSEDARMRYMLDEMSIRVDDESAVEMVTQDFFASTDELDRQLPWARFFFDAAYTFIIAANSLMNEGVQLADISGTALLDAMLTAQFEGLTGNVSFDSNGDRMASLQLLNYQVHSAESSQWVHVGDYRSDSTGGTLSLHANLTWAPHGTASIRPPAELFECMDGFERLGGSSVCTPCRKGVGCGYNQQDGFPLGAILPITSRSHAYLACAIAFDIDFRKNFEPALRERFGPPIVNISNLHPALKIKLQIGTSDTSADVAMNSVLDMFQGAGDFSIIAGLVFGGPSSLSVLASSNAAVFNVPTVAWSSTSPALSDKAQYPYFSRVIAPDTLQTRAIWAWATSFGIPAMVFFYVRDTYGEGLFQSAADVASALGKSHLLLAVSVRPVRSGLDLQEIRDACSWMQQTGTKFVVLGMSSVEASHLMYVMEEMDMLYGPNAYQLFGAEAVALTAEADHQPSEGLPSGFQKLLPTLEGSLFPLWAQLYRNMTPDDMYSPEARYRYMLDSMHLPLSEGFAPPFTEEAFDTLPPPSRLVPNIFDALYTFTIAINDLLNAGVEPSQIRGEILLNAVRRTTFEGITGNVSFNENGDRPGQYELWDWGPFGEGNTIVGRVAGRTDASTGLVELTVDASRSGLYWAGGVSGVRPPMKLFECQPGWRTDGDLQRCVTCPFGWYSEGGVGTLCEVCAFGTESASNGTACLPCQVGKFKGSESLTCADCPQGRFGRTSSASACEFCPVGQYASEVGLTVCSQCGVGRSSQALFTTMMGVRVGSDSEYSKVEGSRTPFNCGCDRHTREDSEGECVSCSEGMLCRGMNDVSIEEGYYADTSLSIFRCYGDSRRCSGGDPGDTCADGRRGIACGECEPEMTDGSGGQCEPCSGEDQAPFFVFVVVLILVTVVVYEVTYCTQAKSKSLSLIICTVAVGQLVTALQQFSVLGLLSVDWVDPFKWFMNIMGVLVFDINVLRLGCMGNFGAVQRYLFKFTILPFTFLTIFFVFVADVYFRKGMQFRKHRWQLVAAISALLLAFYITMCSVALEPFHCKDHPNGRWTVWTMQAVVCWETWEHIIMIVSSGIAVIFVCGGYLAAICAVVIQFPARLQQGDARFVRAFSFLFFRFRPGKHFFIIVHLVKGFALAACPLIPDPALALVMLGAILLASFAATLICLPWRTPGANLLDAFLHTSMLLIVDLSMLFVRDVENGLVGVSWICFLIAGMGLSLVPLAVLHRLVKPCITGDGVFDFFLCHHKVGSGAFARLLKMCLLAAKKGSGQIFIDSDNLDNLDNLFEYVLVTRTLVIVATEHVFERPWCLGEMATARLSKVPTVLLRLPDAPEIMESFLAAWRSKVDLQILTEKGMDPHVIEDTLRWTRHVYTIQVPPSLRHGIMDCVVTRLHGRHEVEAVIDVAEVVRDGRGTSETSLGSASGGRRCCVLFDVTNLEAAATAHVLQRMIVPLVPDSADLVPRILESEADHFPMTALLLVICFNGTLEREYIMKMLLSSRASRCPLCPVLAEAVFRFPPKDVAMWLSQTMPKGIDPCYQSQLVSIISELFKEIATTFHSNSASIEVLQVNANEILRRIQSSAITSAGSRLDRALSRKSSRKDKKGKLRKSMTSLDDGQPEQGEMSSSVVDEGSSIASESEASPRDIDSAGSPTAAEDDFTFSSEALLSDRILPPCTAAPSSGSSGVPRWMRQGSPPVLEEGASWDESLESRLAPHCYASSATATTLTQYVSGPSRRSFGTLSTGPSSQLHGSPVDGELFQQLSDRNAGAMSYLSGGMSVSEPDGTPSRGGTPQESITMFKKLSMAKLERRPERIVHMSL